MAETLATQVNGARVSAPAEKPALGFDLDVLARMNGAADASIPEKPAPRFDQGVLNRINAKAQPAASSVPLTTEPVAAEKVATPAPVTAPAPVDPLQAALSQMAATQKALLDAFTLMSAPRVIVRDEQGRIIRSEVQHSKDKK